MIIKDVDADGNVYLFGSSVAADGRSRGLPFLNKYARNGRLLWGMSEPPEGLFRDLWRDPANVHEPIGLDFNMNEDIRVGGDPATGAVYLVGRSSLAGGRRINWLMRVPATGLP